MKKFLSALLCVMMLSSVFAVSVSAAPTATYEPINVYLFNQDYQGDAEEFMVEGIKVPEAEGSENYVLDAKNTPASTYITASCEDFAELDKFVLEFDVKAAYASAPVIVGFKNETYGNYGATFYPGSFVELTQYKKTAANGLSTDTAVVGEGQSISSDEWMTFRITMNVAGMEKSLSAYEGYYFNYPPAYEEIDGKKTEVAIDGWGITAGLTNSVAKNIINANMTIDVKKGDGEFQTIKTKQTGLSYPWADQPRAQYTTSAIPVAAGDCDVCITVQRTTASHESVLDITESVEGEGDEAVVKYTKTSLGTNANYIFDNIGLHYGSEKLASVADTVYASQDYEDENNKTASTAQYGIGTVERVTEDGNTYLVSKPNASGTAPILVGQNMGFDDKTNVEVSFDLRAMKPGSYGIELYNSGDPTQKGTVFIRTDECMELGKWYRVKFCAGGRNSIYAAIKNLTDDGAWIPLRWGKNGSASDAYAEFGSGSAASSMDKGIRLMQVSTASLIPADTAVGECEWHIDNILVRSREYINVSDFEDDGTEVSVKVDCTIASEYLLMFDETAAYSVMLASYDESGALVDAAIKNVAPVGAGVEDVELTADKTDDMRIYVWNTASGAPLLGNVFDLDAWL